MLDHSIDSLSSVSGTMLITLYARAKETLSVDPIIKDNKAVEIIEIFKKEIADSKNPIHQRIVHDRYNPKLAVTMALRSRRFDRYTQDFLARHPKGTVINFGCGLDTRFDRIDNGSMRWFDIDFAPVIALRRRFMQESDRRKFIAGSILEPDWTRAVKTGGPYLILAEGVFMYLNEADVRSMLAMIKRELGEVELVCEIYKKIWADRARSKYMQRKFTRQLGFASDAVPTFGIPDGRCFETWDKDYNFLDEWTYFDDREKKLGWFNWFAGIELFRKVQWTVHYRISPQNS